MKKTILLLLFSSAIYCQSGWQVYQAIWDDSFSPAYWESVDESQVTAPLLLWWQLDVGFNYSNLPAVLQSGFSHALGSSGWGSSLNNPYLNLGPGNDVSVIEVYDKPYTDLGFAPVEIDDQTGQILEGNIELNTGQVKKGFINYNVVWNLTGLCGYDEFSNPPVLNADSRATVTHEVGHIFGIAHHKTGTNGETMSTWNQCGANGYSPATRMNIKSEDWSALDFLYDFPALTSVTITGNYTLYAEMTGIWAATPNVGRPAFTYNWEIMYTDGGGYLESYESVKKEKDKMDKDKKDKKKDDLWIEAAPS